MFFQNTHRFCVLTSLAVILLSTFLCYAQKPPQPKSALQKRWLFIWRDMSDVKEVDRMIARFPRAQAAGYNGVAFSSNVPAEKAPELRKAAKRYGLDLIAIVMGSTHDKNYVEGILSKDALFVVHDGVHTRRTLDAGGDGHMSARDMPAK